MVKRYAAITQMPFASNHNGPTMNAERFLFCRKGLEPLEDFASKASMAFAAAAWSDPLIVRIFYINKDSSATERTFQNGTWSDTTDDMLENVKGMRPGQPVAASRSVNGSGRYLQYLYADPDGKIMHVARNGVSGAYYMGAVAEYKRPPPLSKSDKYTIAGSVGGVVGAAAGVGLCLFNRKFRGWVRRILGLSSKEAATDGSGSD